MRQRLTLFLIALCWGWSAQAQVFSPLTQDPSRARQLPHKRKPTADPLPLADGDTLGLPFFDDFAKGEGSPDPARWVNRGGAYVSDRYAKKPPTVFAATFDGFDANGVPRGGLSAVGLNDTLTSKPLLLGRFQPQDSLYLSFYWQAGGLLDAPNYSGGGNYYLRLEFKEATGGWQQVWEQRGTGRSTEFAAVMVVLKENGFLYDGFQFRWVSGGGQNGLRDVWHVDYVFLDKNRRKGQLQVADVAFTSQLPSLLNRYTAMPVWHFSDNPGGELRQQVGAQFVNYSGVPAAISWRAFARNLTTGAVDTFLRGSAPVAGNAQQTIAGVPSAAFLGTQSTPFSVQTTQFLNTKEPLLHTLYNDTLTRQTDLHDYFAYDDGSAEGTLSFPSSSAVNVAYQFDLTKPDRVKRVRLFFTGANTPGTTLYLRIWGDQNGRPADQPLVEQPFSVPPADQFNNWLDIELTQPIAVQGRFYVGYRQPAGATFVNIGFDLSEDAEGKMLLLRGTTTSWETLTGLGGALMIRPVMAGTITSAAEEIASAAPFLFPNPASDWLKVGQKAERLEVYSLTGQLVQVWQQVRAGQQLSLVHLPAGLYLVKAINGTQVRTSKLILQR